MSYSLVYWNSLGFTQCHLISAFQALFCLTSYSLTSYSLTLLPLTLLPLTLLPLTLLLSYKKGTTSELMMPFYDLKI